MHGSVRRFRLHLRYQTLLVSQVLLYLLLHLHVLFIIHLHLLIVLQQLLHGMGPLFRLQGATVLFRMPR